MASAFLRLWSSGSDAPSALALATVAKRSSKSSCSRSSSSSPRTSAAPGNGLSSAPGHRWQCRASTILPQPWRSPNRVSDASTPMSAVHTSTYSYPRSRHQS